jgi:hypothetical protein
MGFSGVVGGAGPDRLDDWGIPPDQHHQPFGAEREETGRQKTQYEQAAVTGLMEAFVEHDGLLK